MAGVVMVMAEVRAVERAAIERRTPWQYFSGSVPESRRTRRQDTNTALKITSLKRRYNSSTTKLYRNKSICAEPKTRKTQTPNRTLAERTTILGKMFENKRKSFRIW
jgi:hypothetical protein